MAEPEQPTGGLTPRRLPEWRRNVLDERAEELARIFQDAGVELVYVFGSLARGREKDRKAISDLDLAVVFPDNLDSGERRSRWYDLREALEQLFVREDFDLVIANEATSALKFQIIKDRDLLWSSSDAALAKFESAARRDWNDMQYFRTLQRQALERRYGIGAD